MPEFNQNPFLKETPVTPFSNASEAEIWKSNNCDICKDYDSESAVIEQAKCPLAFNIDVGFIVGTIPLWVAKDIGCKYDPLYQTCKLHSRCRKFNSGNMPF